MTDESTDTISTTAIRDAHNEPVPTSDLADAAVVAILNGWGDLPMFAVPTHADKLVASDTNYDHSDLPGVAHGYAKDWASDYFADDDPALTREVKDSIVDGLASHLLSELTSRQQYERERNKKSEEQRRMERLQMEHQARQATGRSRRRR